MKILMSSLAALALTLGACGGGGDPPPQNPEPEPGGCCQLDDRCVQSDDANACTTRGGEFVDSANCVENVCM